jgi:hypothetical protein
MPYTRPWEEDEQKVLSEFYPNIDSARIGKQIDRSPKAVRDMAARMGLKKTKARVLESCRENRARRGKKSA